jgi:WD40 repeat protein
MYAQAYYTYAYNPKPYIKSPAVFGEELRRSKCKIHGARYQLVCLEDKCISSNTSFLCPECVKAEHSTHTFFALPYVFADDFLQDAKELMNKKADEHYRRMESNKLVLLQIDEAYDRFQKELIKLLDKSRDRLKESILRDDIGPLRELRDSWVDLLQQDLSDNQGVANYLNSFKKYHKIFDDLSKIKQEQEPLQLNEESSSQVASVLNNHLATCQQQIQALLEKTVDLDQLVVQGTGNLHFQKERSKTPISNRDYTKFKHQETFALNHSGEVNKLIFLEDTLLATCSADKTIKIWRFGRSLPEKTLSGHTDSVTNIIGLAGNKLASASKDHTIRIWDLKQGVAEKVLNGHQGDVLALTELAKNGLISGSVDKTLKVWDTSKDGATTPSREILNGGDCRVVIFVSNEDIAAGSGNEIKLYNFENAEGEKEPLKVLSGHQGLISDLLLSRDNGRLLSASADGRVIVWDLKSYSPILKLAPKEVVPAVRMIFIKETILAVAHGNGEINFWNLNDGKCEKTLQENKTAIKSISISANGPLLTCDETGKVSVYGD